MEKNSKIDKERFKEIFKDYWDEFKDKNPRYSGSYYSVIIEKMLNCGSVVSGYSEYVCSECGQDEKK